MLRLLQCMACFVLVLSCTPAPRPSAINPPNASAGPSDASRQLRAYYAARLTTLKAQGLMRTDFAPADAAFNAQTLIKDFRRIALYTEYTRDAPGLVAQETVSSLGRWQKPIALGIYFGPSVPSDRRRVDQREIQSYARRLGAITGLRVQFTSIANANFIVAVLSLDEMRSELPTVLEDVPYATPRLIQEVSNLPREISCVVYGQTSADPPFGYVGAVAIIRDELPDLTRQSCVHEELAQGLGLINDADDVRPSVFNDDEEFALLTRHDEVLLKMLYDPRLRDGMTPQERAPILVDVARDAMRQSRI